MKHLENICKNENIPFSAVGSHCRCIAHIMNLVVQDILKQIKAGEAQTEDIILDDIDNIVTAGEVIPKVSLLFINYNVLIVIILIIYIYFSFANLWLK